MECIHDYVSSHIRELMRTEKFAPFELFPHLGRGKCNQYFLLPNDKTDARSSPKNVCAYKIIRT